MARETVAAQLERLRLENEQLLESRRLADEARDRYMDLYEYAPLAHLTLDDIGVMHEVNRAAARLLDTGAERHHLVGSRLKRLVFEADHGVLAKHLNQCVAGGEAVIACELRLQTSTPVQLWSRCAGRRLRVFPTVIVDLTAREMAAVETRRLMTAEKEARAASEAKDQFIATLSHELRTPLTPVLAAVTALQDRRGFPDGLRNIFEMIRRNILIEARLIDDLLDLTRITRGKMGIERRPTDVHEAAREALETLGAEIAAKHLSTGVFLEAEHHYAAGDAVRLQQVFWNLLRNAVKFTPGGGRIELRSWNNAINGGRGLHVEVRDTGMGFDPSVAPRLFEAFEQGADTPERSGGLGLGLAICKGVMELHGGSIAASSGGAGMGSRFVITLETINELPARPPDMRPAAIPGPAMARRILLVEDDPDTMEILGELLNEAGFEVRTARTAKAALEVDLDSVDLMISDIGLPGTSGLDLMRSIRADRPLKAVALSGYGTEADIRASEEAGFNAHLTKPVDFERLLATICQVSSSSPHDASL